MRTRRLTRAGLAVTALGLTSALGILPASAAQQPAGTAAGTGTSTSAQAAVPGPQAHAAGYSRNQLACWSWGYYGVLSEIYDLKLGEKPSAAMTKAIKVYAKDTENAAKTAKDDALQKSLRKSAKEMRAWAPVLKISKVQPLMKAMTATDTLCAKYRA